MSNSFFVFLKNLLLLLILSVFIICLIFIPTLDMQLISSSSIDTSYSFILTNDKYVWPIPGYTSITSPFGKRYSPTVGASSYHKGIDVAAPQNTALYAVTSGLITFTGFLGGGGYTITLTNKNMKITYCHVSPNYIVKKGEAIQKGQLLRICWT